MRPLHIDPADMVRRTREVNKEQARRMLMLDKIEALLTDVGEAFGGEAVTELKPMLDPRGNAVKDDKGRAVEHRDAVKDDDGQPVFKDIGMDEPTYALYLATCSLVQLLRKEWDYGR